MRSDIVILSHRGWWKTPEEKNSAEALQRSLDNGFGFETDLRDLQGRIVVSHDPPRGGEMLLEQLMDICRPYPDLPLALNVKADGLQRTAGEVLKKAGLRNFFFFDMSIPDALGYLREKLPFFTRQSEYEVQPSLYEEAAGIWMDCFETEWMDRTVIANHLKAGKQVCLVSPELHKRPHLAFWERLRAMDIDAGGGLSLCTDFPVDAQAFFNK